MKQKFLIVFLIALASCKDTPYFNEKTVAEWARRDTDLPSAHAGLIMFVSLEEGQVAMTNVDQLHRIYIKRYTINYSTFANFLFVALNQRMTFQARYFDRSARFIKNSVIISESKELGVQRFKNKYCQGNRLKNTLSRDGSELHTVMYVFFINGNSLGWDDYIGHFMVFPVGQE